MVLWDEELTLVVLLTRVLFLCSPASSSALPVYKAVVESSSCLLTGSFWGTNSTSNTLELWQITFTHHCLSFKMGSIAGVGFFLADTACFIYCRKQKYLCCLVWILQIMFPPAFVLLACWSWKCNLILFCLLLLYKLLNINTFQQFRARLLLRL